MSTSRPLSTYEQLRQRVLAQLADQQVDRDQNPEAVRQQIREVVHRYQQEAATGISGQKLSDPDQTIGRLSRSVLGYGPLHEFLEGAGPGPADAEVVEVEIRGRNVTWRDGRGRWQSLAEPTTEDELRSVVDRLLAAAGSQLTEVEPVISTQVLDRRARLTASIPPVSDRLEVNLRFYGTSWRSLDDLIALDTLSSVAAGLLGAAMAHPQTGLVISGRPQSGKTTMANALLRAVPGSHVVACCEDTRELSAPLAHVSYRRTTQQALGSDGSEVTLARLVELALRSSPDRIVVGEVRGGEAAVLLRAANAGSAMMVTLHANSAEDALGALAETALLFADHSLPAAAVRARLARSVDLIVHMDSEDFELRGQVEDRPVRRQVMEIAAVSPLQASSERFTVVPIFEREAVGAPLARTVHPVPEQLARKLAPVLQRQGTDLDGLLTGQEVAHT